MSHNRTCPEYDPPKISVGWNGEKVTESTSDWGQILVENEGARGRTGEWKTNSGRSSRCKFHTATIPSGSFGAAGFLLYAATASSGNWNISFPCRTRIQKLTLGDQSRSVTDRPAVHLSSEKAQNSLTRCPSDSSLHVSQVHHDSPCSTNKAPSTPIV